MAAPKGNQNAVGNKGGGRPELYQTEYAIQAKKLCLLGATDKDLADFFEVGITTVNQWKLDRVEFSEALRDGKILADAEVVHSLYKRATGYTGKKTVTASKDGIIVDIRQVDEEVAPDVKAATFWLTNRQRKRWSERVEHTGGEGKDLIPKVDEMEVARRVAFMLTQASLKKE